MRGSRYTGHFSGHDAQAARDAGPAAPGPQAPDYDAIRDLPRSEIAWEFLRRNPDYRRDVRDQCRPSLRQEADWGGAPVFRQIRDCEAAARWGLVALCDPAQPAPCANVFWRRGKAAIGIVLALGQDLPAELRTLSPRFLVNLDNETQLHVRHGTGSMTIDVVEPGNSSIDCGLFLHIRDADSVDAVSRLLRLVRRSPRAPAWTAQRLSLRDALIAYDGSADGLRYRDIAIRLVGAERVRAAWGQGSTALKDRVRRALKRGCRLVDGDYRVLLRRSSPA